MDIFKRIFISSADLASGPFNAGSNPGCRRAFFDFSMYNTVYNIPELTAYEFGDAGSFTSIPIPAGMYTFTNILDVMKTEMQTIIPGVDVVRDGLTGKLIITAMSTPTMNIRFTSSSQYLCSLLGVTATTYTGSSIVSDYVMKLFPGTGLKITVSGILSPTIAEVHIYVPWAESGGAMFNDDIGSAKAWYIDQAQNFSAVNVGITNVFGDTVNLNGGDFLLILNLVA